MAMPPRFPPQTCFLASMAAVALGLLSLFLPADLVRTDGGTYSTRLAWEHSGKIAAVFLLAMAAGQGWFWIQRKRWVAWPGWVAGLYITLFATARLLRLWWQHQRLEELNHPLGATVQPQAGLLLLLASGIALLAIQVIARQSQPQ